MVQNSDIDSVVDDAITSLLGVTVGGVAAYNIYTYVSKLTEENSRLKDKSIRKLIREYGKTGNPDKPAVLLLHGFCGSPYDFAPILDNLEKSDLAYYAPMLAGHGCSSSSGLNNISFQHWREGVFLALDKIIHQHGKSQIDVIGFSLGALLALDIIPHEKVRRTVLINPFTEVPKVAGLDAFAAARTAGSFVPYVAKLGHNIREPKGRKKYQGSYVHFPVNAYNQLQLYANLLWQKATTGKIVKPIFFAISTNDSVSNPIKMQEYANRICVHRDSIIKEYANSEHGLIFDYDGKQLGMDINEFLEIKYHPGQLNIV